MDSECFKFYSNIYSKVLTGFILPIILKVNISEKLCKGPQRLEDLVEGTQINKERLQRYLLQLESSGIFFYDTLLGKWSNNENSGCLSIPSVKSILIWRFSSYYHSKYFDLNEMLYSEKSACELQNSTFFEDLRRNSEYLIEFQNCMKGMTETNSGEIKETIDLSDSLNVIDIGGGDGSLLISLLEKYPHIKGTVFERPETVELASLNILEKNLQNQIKTVSGDFFVEVPSGFDTFILKHILHDWPDEKCIEILENCRKKMGKNGKIFIVDTVLNNNSEFYKHQRYYDVLMMVILNAQERSETQFQKLLEKFGLKISRIFPALYENVIEAVIA